MDSKILSGSQLEELRELIDAVDRLMVTSNYQMLSSAKIGSRLSLTNSAQLVLDKELTQIQRIRELLGLPLMGKGSKYLLPEPQQAEQEEPLREQLVKKGIEPDSYRNVRIVRERRLAKKS